jgi:hypothetical protein
MPLRRMSLRRLGYRAMQLASGRTPNLIGYRGDRDSPWTSRGGHRLVLPRNVLEESGTIRHDYIEARVKAEEVFR